MVDFTNWKYLLKKALEGLFLPFLAVFLFQSTVFILLAPAPLIYGHFRYGRSLGFLFMTISLLLISIIGSHVSILLFISVPLLITFVFSEISKKYSHVNLLISRTIFILILCYVSALLVISKGRPYAYLHTLGSQYVSSLPALFEKHKESSAFLQKFHSPVVDQWKMKLLEIAGKADSTAAQFIQERLFAYAISTLVLIFWFIILILKFFKIHIVKNDLSTWKTPDQLVWVFISAFFFTEFTFPLITPIAKNIFTILLVIYFLQGIAIGSFYFSFKKYSQTQKIIGYSLLVVFPFFTTCFGFFDLWINFRNYMSKQNKKPVLRPKI